MLLILDPPQPRNMTKANPAFSPLAVGGDHVFRHKSHRSRLANELVLVRVGLRRDQGKHSRPIGRSNAHPSLSGLQADVIGQIESQLIYVKLQAAVLIANEDIDGINAEVGILAILRKRGWMSGSGCGASVSSSTKHYFGV